MPLSPTSSGCETRGDQPGNAWRGARHRVRAPEMSTIVRAAEETGQDLPGDTRLAEVGGRTPVETFVPVPRWGCLASPTSHPGIASWGGAHTHHSSPPHCPPLIVKSSEWRSKLTFCTLHYAPPRVPWGLGPAPSPRRQLDWAINLRVPHPPPGPGPLCS